MDDEELKTLPETRALMLIREIYLEENQLKEMTADERAAARKTKVEPKVDAFFGYVHSLDSSDEIFSDRMNKAITYAVMYSIVETAKANRANGSIYLQYLFEQIPLRRAGGEKDFMADMMPWSEAYRVYEDKTQQQRRSMYRQLFPEPERPRTPRKRDGILEDNGLTA